VIHPTRALQIVLALAVVATFAVSELLRGPVQTNAAIVSMVGWAGFVLLFFWWLWEDCGVVEGIRRLGRLLALTAVAVVVLYLHYRRSHVLDAGVEVDATYTFMGLGWFLELRTPITFAGQTVSFPQMPMQLLGHLPAYLVGFDRLGPFAIHVAIILQVGFLLALLVTTVVSASLATQAACVVLAAGVFANRLTVLLCNLTGYAIPSLSIGMMFLGLVIRPRSFERTAPWIGGLLMLSLMHHYPGFFFVLPLVALWVVAGWQPWWRVATFVGANLPLCVVLAMAIANLSLHPELLLARIRAVTTPGLALEEMRAKVVLHWANLTGPFFPQFVETFFRRSQGSWHLLNLAPLGALVAPIVAANWLVTATSLGRRGLAFVGALAALAACLVVLTAMQHLVTGFENYRDMTLLLALTTVGIGFVLRIPEVGAVPRVLLIAYALAVAAYQYVDVGELAGKHYMVDQYAPNEQATMEALRDYWRHDGGEHLRDTAVRVVVPMRFPLEHLYTHAATEHRITLSFMPAIEFCPNVAAALEKTATGYCGRIAFAMRGNTCGTPFRAAGWPVVRRPDRVAIYLFEAACEPAMPRDWSKPQLLEVPVPPR
jgi:hypothetical protein